MDVWFRTVSFTSNPNILVITWHIWHFTDPLIDWIKNFHLLPTVLINSSRVQHRQHLLVRVVTREVHWELLPADCEGLAGCHQEADQETSPQHAGEERGEFHLRVTSGGGGGYTHCYLATTYRCVITATLQSLSGLDCCRLLSLSLSLSCHHTITTPHSGHGNQKDTARAVVSSQHVQTELLCLCYIRSDLLDLIY